MDWTAEYAMRYHGAPRPDQPWHEVVALLERIPRFSARAVLERVQAHGLSEGLKGGAGESQMAYAKLERSAWPS